MFMKTKYIFNILMPVLFSLSTIPISQYNILNAQTSEVFESFNEYSLNEEIKNDLEKTQTIIEDENEFLDTGQGNFKKIEVEMSSPNNTQENLQGQSYSNTIYIETKQQGEHMFRARSTDGKGNFSEWGNTIKVKIQPTGCTFDSCPVYRFQNKNNEAFFFTIDESEKKHVMEKLSDTWQYQGANFNAYKNEIPEKCSTTNNKTKCKPVYRFFIPNTQSHFFTQNEIEKDNLKQHQDFIFEGIAFYAHTEDIDGKTQTNLNDNTLVKPVYRFFKTTTKMHFFTVSESEKSNFTNRFIGNFNNEGISFYVIESTSLDSTSIQSEDKMFGINTLYKSLGDNQSLFLNKKKVISSGIETLSVQSNTEIISDVYLVEGKVKDTDLKELDSYIELRFDYSKIIGNKDENKLFIKWYNDYTKEWEEVLSTFYPIQNIIKVYSKRLGKYAIFFDKNDISEKKQFNLLEPLNEESVNKESITLEWEDVAKSINEDFDYHIYIGNSQNTLEYFNRTKNNSTKIKVERHKNYYWKIVAKSINNKTKLESPIWKFGVLMDAPKITSTPPTTALNGSTFEYNPIVANKTKNTLTFNLSGNYPKNISFNEDNGNMYWRVKEEENNTYLFNLSVSNGTLLDSQTIELKVLEPKAKDIKWNSFSEEGLLNPTKLSQSGTYTSSVDSFGNTYVLGFSTNDTVVGNFNLSPNENVYFLTKYNINGEIEWLYEFRNMDEVKTALNIPHQIIIDSSNNIKIILEQKSKHMRFNDKDIVLNKPETILLNISDKGILNSHVTLKSLTNNELHRDNIKIFEDNIYIATKNNIFKIDKNGQETLIKSFSNINIENISVTKDSLVLISETKPRINYTFDKITHSSKGAESFVLKLNLKTNQVESFVILGKSNLEKNISFGRVIHNDTKAFATISHRDYFEVYSINNSSNDFDSSLFEIDFEKSKAYRKNLINGDGDQFIKSVHINQFNEPLINIKYDGTPVVNNIKYNSSPKNIDTHLIVQFKDGYPLWTKEVFNLGGNVNLELNLLENDEMVFIGNYTNGFILDQSLIKTKQDLGMFVIKTKLPNTPPVVTSPNSLKTNERSLFTHKITYTDRNANDDIKFSLVNSPVGMTISDEGEVKWQTFQSDVGLIKFTVVLNDGFNTVNHQIELLINRIYDTNFINSLNVNVNNSITTEDGGIVIFSNNNISKISAEGKTQFSYTLNSIEFNKYIPLNSRNLEIKGISKFQDEYYFIAKSERTLNKKVYSFGVLGKLNRFGESVWIKEFKNSTNTLFSDIKINKEGQILVTELTEKSLLFFDTKGENIQRAGLPSQFSTISTSDIFGNNVLINNFEQSGNNLQEIALIDSNQKLKWLVSLNKTSFENLSKLSIAKATLDLDGNVFTVGSVYSSTTKSYDIFVAKFDKNSNLKWVQTIGENTNEYGNDIATDLSGNIYLVGKNYEGKTILIYIDTEGQIIKSKILNIEAYNNITVSNDNSVILSGKFIIKFLDGMELYQKCAEYIRDISFNTVFHPTTIYKKDYTFTKNTYSFINEFNNSIYVKKDTMFSNNIVAEFIDIQTPPQFISTPPSSIETGLPFKYMPLINDQNTREKHVFSLSNQPSGMTIDGYTGLVSWLPDINKLSEINEVSFEISVWDGRYTVKQPVKLYIENKLTTHIKDLKSIKLQPNENLVKLLSLKNGEIIKQTKESNGYKLTLLDTNGEEILSKLTTISINDLKLNSKDEILLYGVVKNGDRFGDKYYSGIKNTNGILLSLNKNMVITNELRLTSDYSNSITHIDVTKSNDILICGKFSKELNINGVNIINKNTKSTDNFLIQLDEKYNIKWSKIIESQSELIKLKIFNDSIIAILSQKDSFKIDNREISKSKLNDLLVINFNLKGELNWFKQISSENIYLTDVLEFENNLLVSGYSTKGNLFINKNLISEITNGSHFLIKLDSNGNIIFNNVIESVTPHVVTNITTINDLILINGYCSFCNYSGKGGISNKDNRLMNILIDKDGDILSEKYYSNNLELVSDNFLISNGKPFTLFKSKLNLLLVDGTLNRNDKKENLLYIGEISLNQ